LQLLFDKDRVAFWKELNKNQKSKLQVEVPILKLKSEYERLFNEKLIQTSEMNQSIKETNRIIENAQPLQVRLNDAEIIDILKGLSNGKSSGPTGIKPEMYKYGIGHHLIKILNYSYSNMINRSVMPHMFNVGIIKPIIKDARKATNDISNLRPIMISDVMATVFENILLRLIEKYHCNNNRQFGFKKNSSCGHAVYALLETIKFNTRRRNKTYICAIDASKAFDKVNRDLLWLKALKTLPAGLVKVIKAYYEISLALVNNNKCTSNLFKTSIGVKQGGPLSPRLFSIYIEDIIEEIERIGAGTTIKNQRVDILLYADDIILISDSENGLQRMIQKVEEFGNKWEIKFNPEKTVYMRFNDNNKKNKTELTMNRKLINEVTEVKYLGMYIDNKLNPEKHINKKRLAALLNLQKLKKSVLAHGLSVKAKMQLYKTYIRPTLYYGAELLNLNQNHIKAIQTSESNMIKNLFQIKKRSHSSILLRALGLNRVREQIEEIRTRFLLRVMDNEYTKSIAENIGFECSSKLRTTSLIEYVQTQLTDNEQFKSVAELGGWLKVRRRIIKQENSNENEIERKVKRLLNEGCKGVQELNAILSVNY
jgi:hypothetical protein